MQHERARPLPGRVCLAAPTLASPTVPPSAFVAYLQSFTFPNTSLAIGGVRHQSKYDEGLLPSPRQSCAEGARPAVRAVVFSNSRMTAQSGQKVELCLK